MKPLQKAIRPPICNSRGYWFLVTNISTIRAAQGGRRDARRNAPNTARSFISHRTISLVSAHAGAGIPEDWFGCVDSTKLTSRYLRGSTQSREFHQDPGNGFFKR